MKAVEQTFKLVFQDMIDKVTKRIEVHMSQDSLTNDPNFCHYHQCKKTWMLQTSFCPKCEEALHGDKGRVSPKSQTASDPDKTVPDAKNPWIDIGPLDWNDLKIKWEAKYGQFDTLKIDGTPSTRVQDRCCYFRSYYGTIAILISSKRKYLDLLNAGYPEGNLFTDWHPAIAKVWPI